MESSIDELMKKNNLRVGVIVSKFNQPVTDNLYLGAVKAFEDSGISSKSLELFNVPGAFEIPLVMKKLCIQNFNNKCWDGILTIGCVIKGETAHFEYICENVSQSIMKLSYEYEMPTGFCVLTCFTPQQAYERSLIPPDAHNNKGYEAALTLVEMINLLKKI
ncbi:MAG: 6,7-dimethyl-8-ribityllumazine synthase [Ignavibacteria bacterium]